MESWQDGREELVGELMKTYVKLGANMGSELDIEQNVVIDREKLRTLQIKANRADELDTEVSNLKFQKRAQDSNAARLIQEKSAENQRLTEENHRLVERIEEHKGDSLQVQTLQKEKGLLATELLRMQAAERNEDQALRLIPGLVEGPISVRKITEYDGLEPVASDVYRSLVVKYNTLMQNWSDLKVARKTLHETATKERKKVKEWIAHGEHLEKKIAKREAKIKLLEEKVRLLNGQLQTSSSIANISPARSPISPAAIRPSANIQSSLEDGSAVANSKSLGLIFVNGQALRPQGNRDEMISSDLETSLRKSNEVQVPRSSSLAKIFKTNEISTRHLGHDNGKHMPRAFNGEMPEEEQNHHGSQPTSPNLPMLLNGGEYEENVDDTQFELIVPYHSSSTEGDVESPVLPDIPIVEATSNLPSSPDIPIVVYSRFIKKRKSRKETDEVSPLTRIKIETITSSPLGLAALHGLDISQSLDLDEIGEKQSTPRKRRLLHRIGGASLDDTISIEADISRRYRSESVDQSHPMVDQEHTRQSQSTPINRTPPSRRDSALRPRSTNQQILPRTSDERAVKRRHLVSDEAVGALFEDGENLEASGISQTEELRPDARLIDLLNKPTPPTNPCLSSLRKYSASASKTPTPNPAPDRSGVTSTRTTDFRTYEPDPADDFAGARYSRAKDSPAIRTIDRPADIPKYDALTGVPRRLKGAPDNGTTALQSLEGTPKSPRSLARWNFRDSAYGSRPPSRASAADADDHQLEAPLSKGQSRLRELFAKPTSRTSVLNSMTPSKPSSKNGGKSSTNTNMTVSKRLSNTAREIFEVETDHPANEPLRSRPFEKLDISDFRINPNNGGHSFAYSEVVRGKERRCLPGCTKPECCGSQFRFLAKISRDPNIPPTPSQEEKNQEILEEYLGDATYKLRNMTKAQRDELLLQAQTRDLTNKYGKHRQAFERRQSPPGFWRFGFPSTQEQVEDASKQHEFQRDLVRQRYQEAMRPNGRYIFRDE